MDKIILVKYSVAGKILFWEIEVIDNVIITTSYLQGGKKKVIETIVREGKNIGKRNETTPEEQAVLMAQSKIDSKIKKDTYEIYNNKAPKQKRKVYDPLKSTVMLFKRSNLREKWVTEGCFQQPKIDGLRCVAYYSNGWNLISRNRNKYPFLTHIKKDLNNLDRSLIYDGELCHRLGFQKLVNIVSANRKEPAEPHLEKEVYYTIFDIIDYDLPQDVRIEILNNFKSVAKYIDVITSIEVDNWDSIRDVHASFVRRGLEGSIIRHKKKFYESKRSSYCMKYKDFDTTDYRIVDYTEGTGSHEGLIIWICETPSGATFQCVPAATWDVRSSLLAEADSHIGKFLTVQHQGLSEDGIPRFPQGICIREFIE